MRLARPLLLATLTLVAITLQVSVFPHLAVTGVVPDVVLVLVVATALVGGPQLGAQLGLVAGLALDLAPPADHTLGRWALALVVVGYLAGLVRQDTGRSVPATAMTAAACSFIGTSLFAISGIALGDLGVTVARVLALLPLTTAYDVLLALVVVPITRTWLVRLESRAVRW